MHPAILAVTLLLVTVQGKLDYRDCANAVDSVCVRPYDSVENVVCHPCLENVYILCKHSKANSLVACTNGQKLSVSTKSCVATAWPAADTVVCGNVNQGLMLRTDTTRTLEQPLSGQQSRRLMFDEPFIASAMVRGFTGSSPGAAGSPAASSLAAVPAAMTIVDRVVAKVVRSFAWFVSTPETPTSSQQQRSFESTTVEVDTRQDKLVETVSKPLQETGSKHSQAIHKPTRSSSSTDRKAADFPAAEDLVEDDRSWLLDADDVRSPEGVMPNVFSLPLEEKTARLADVSLPVTSDLEARMVANGVSEKGNLVQRITGFTEEGAYELTAERIGNNLDIKKAIFHVPRDTDMQKSVDSAVQQMMNIAAVSEETSAARASSSTDEDTIPERTENVKAAV